MRIGVDMASAVGQKSGLGSYLSSVVSAMEPLLEESGDELVRFERIKNNLRTPQRWLWDQVGVPVCARMEKADVLWVPAFSAPRTRLPLVMTAHDIFGVLYPDHFKSKTARHYWTRTVPESMKRADHLVCISQYTKDSIATHLDIDPAKMTVVPLAGSEEFHQVNDHAWLAQQLKELGVDGPFILNVGTLEPRKNVERLVEAFAFANRNVVHPDGSEEPVKLVLVGKKGWDYDGIFEAIRKYHLQDVVVWLDYVTNDQLVALYNTCLFAVLPSIFEGFGLPPLEAMRCGAPVAVAQNTSMPEVVGEAGLLFDPFNVEQIRERINHLLSAPETRADLQQRSLKQANTFSWTDTAQQTLALLRQFGR